jgi:transposase
MDTSAKSDASESSVERTRRWMRTLPEKLAILEEASQPGASVALVARKHGVNANLVFGWLRLHRKR